MYFGHSEAILILYFDRDNVVAEVHSIPKEESSTTLNSKGKKLIGRKFDCQNFKKKIVRPLKVNKKKVRPLKFNRKKVNPTTSEASAQKFSEPLCLPPLGYRYPQSVPIFIKACLFLIAYLCHLRG